MAFIRRIIGRLTRATATVMDRRSQKDEDAGGTMNTNNEIKDSPRASPDSNDAATNTTPSWSGTLWRWGQSTVNTASNFQQQAAATIRTALGQRPPALPSEHSGDTTLQSLKDWVMIYPHRDVGEGYKQYMDEQDAKDYVEVDEKEAESGADDEEENDLGGEKWNTKL